MSDACRITTIIPTYNRAHLVGRAIESALGQTARPDQLIVVDDGSADNTAEVCNAFRGRIQYVRQENAGASAARNTGIRLAEHPWIAFLDSDDLWTPSHLERMRAAIRETAGAASFYFSDMQMTSQDGGTTLWQNSRFVPKGPIEFTTDAAEWMLMRRQPAMLQCSVFNTAVLRKQNGFDLRFRVAEDTELFCRLGIAGAACAVAGVGCIQTSDDQAENRLTNMVSERTAGFWRHRVMLWRHVRERFAVPAQHLALVRYNCAGSYLGLAKVLWHTGHKLRAMWCLAMSFKTDPRLAAWIATHRTSKGYEETVRAAGPSNE